MTVAIREAFGNTLAAMAEDPRIVVLDADLGKATKASTFQKVCPKRYIDVGIAEQNMVGMAAGLAAAGMIPVATTFSVFLTGRAFDQIRNTIAYAKLNVKLVGTHAGVTVGYDGGTHQAVEDVALMRSLPNMTVLAPADAKEAEEALKAAVRHTGPVYLRMSRIAVPDIHTADYQFQIGRGELLRDGDDVGIIATGIMVSKALEAAEELAACGIQAAVVNMPSVKPLDQEIVVSLAKKVGRIVTAEEHSVFGGLGSAVCEVLAQRQPALVRMVGIQDRFGCSGSPDELLREYGLTAADIVAAAQTLCKKE